MTLRPFFISLLSLLALAAFSRAANERPNIIFIMADDLGYGDLGSYGQTIIQTPQLDRMAEEGLRFTDFYAGATVCAPSRCVLMTGKHLGRCHVRGNAGQSDMTAQSLRDEDFTVAEALKSAGYSTSLIGKWGLGEMNEEGHPLLQGFDYFYGYLNQVHAHNYYPAFLWRNRDKENLPNEQQLAPRSYGNFHGGWATKREVYSHDLFMEESLSWIEAHQKNPFFLYLALTIPHANNEATPGTGDGAEVPDYGIYEHERWANPNKGQAAMITRMDEGIGRLLAKLKSLGIADNTLVMFTSDNGPHDEANHNPVLFDPSGPLRGMKRDLFEGGIRAPMIAWWPSQIQPGRVSGHISYSGDLMATVCELAGIKTPDDVNSISFLPTLTGKTDQQKKHDYLYWEFYEQGSAQAIRWENWKAIRRPMFTGRIELYDLSGDPGEKYNLYRDRDKVAQAAKLMDEAHQSHPNWKVRP